MITFYRRTSRPEKTNKFYRRKAYGGVSPCITGKPQYDGQASALANCVGYAWGRVAEYLNNPYIRIGFQSMSADHPSDAHKWYSYAANCGFLTGNVPKIGAVACWKNKKNTGGHVAIVEAVMDNGRVVVSESSYNGYIWAEHTLAASMYKPGLIFQGFIYPSEELQEPLPDTKLRVGDKVRIIGPGNASASGSGKVAWGVGLTRYIYKIYDGPYPYRVGYMNGATTGFYAEASLQKIK